MVKQFLTFILICVLSEVYTQTDSITVKALPLKISHAEPVYIDLIRDLGARKGEKEINVGWEMNDRSRYMEQSGFVEYEFSPLNRLGLEVEVPSTTTMPSGFRAESSFRMKRSKVLSLPCNTPFSYPENTACRWRQEQFMSLGCIPLKRFRAAKKS